MGRCAWARATPVNGGSGTAEPRLRFRREVALVEDPDWVAEPVVVIRVQRSQAPLERRRLAGATITAVRPGL